MHSMWIRSADRLPLGVLISITVVALYGGCGDESGGPVNRAPVIEAVTAEPRAVEPLESSTLNCVADDADGDVLDFDWAAECGTLSGSGASVTWTAPGSFDTCLVTVTVSDGQGGSDAAEISLEVPNGTLLVATEDGLAAVSMDGTYFLYPDIQGPVEVLGDRIFVKQYLTSPDILEIDHQGTTIGSVAIPPGVPWHTWLTVLPDAGFAFLDNANDSIHFSDSQGNLVQSVAIPNGNRQQNQVVDGVVVDGNLIVSENGNDQVIEVDLTTYETSIMRDLSGVPLYLTGIDYSRGWYFIMDSGDVVSRFSEDGPVTPICTLAGVVVGITVVGDYAYVTDQSSAGSTYRVNVNSGASEIFVPGLDNPEDIEYVPMKMEPPVRQ